MTHDIYSGYAARAQEKPDFIKRIAARSVKLFDDAQSSRRPLVDHDAPLSPEDLILARYLAGELGGSLTAGQILCPGPGHSADDRSLKVWMRAAGEFIVHPFSPADDFMRCRDYVRTSLRRAEMAMAAGETPKPLAGPSYRSAASSGDPPALRWERLSPARGTIVKTYLESRGLSLPPELDMRVVRFNPKASRRCAGSGGEDEFIRTPAMVTVLRDLIMDEIRCLQQTFLSADSRKIERRFIAASSPKNAAIKIDPLGSTLFVAEGFETALSARLLGLRPIWALASAGSIAALPVIDGVTELGIVAENDDGASLKASASCAARWEAAGRRVQLYRPDAEFKDFNDVLMGVSK